MGYRLLEALAEVKVLGKEVTGKPVGLFPLFGLSKHSRRTAERWLQLLRTTTARQDFMALAGLTLEQICRVNHPVLAIFGEYSNCLPSCSGLKQHLPNCGVVIVPRAGHFHPVVRPRFFEKELREFLGKVAASVTAV
jgi:pimeloyl-ACP methyl ester carboxylesterase